MRKKFKKRYKTNRYYFIWMLRISRWINESTIAFENTLNRIFGGANNGEHIN